MHEPTRPRAAHYPARRPAADRAAALAAGFPDRLAAGRLHLPARLRQVPGADQPGVHIRAVLGARAKLPARTQRPAAHPRDRKLADLPVGGSLMFDYPGPNDPRVLVRLDEQNLVAYGQQCTHLSCPVIAQAEAGQLHCPCHEGLFDLASGRPLAGPPRRPLPRVTLEVRDGVIYATGVEERTV